LITIDFEIFEGAKKVEKYEESDRERERDIERERERERETEREGESREVYFLERSEGS
jgi:hypothetical protein